MIERFLPASARVRFYALRNAIEDAATALRSRRPARGPAEGLAARPSELQRLQRSKRTAPRRRPRPMPAPDAGAVYPVTFEHAEMTIDVRADQTVLEAGLAAGVPLSFSCTVGGCAACKRKVRSGELEMEYPNCLTEQEHAEGYRLLCISRPRGPVVVA
ncbi:MAG: 2Fe-2S iron-sulfur cluster binding domain-containing protein [Myxococcales bacterium]|nr:2Fe-2S iron-sulfur cluster binding domain-containing protein [Myxococcales bacterium]